eukprot:m.95311 g.95311  ORF g.95311 m.95311 type:complete len:161 (+) comp14763_c0_seq1:1128-1610(+)
MHVARNGINARYTHKRVQHRWAKASRKATSLTSSLSAFTKRLDEQLSHLATAEARSIANSSPLVDEEDRVQQVLSEATREVLESALVTDEAIQRVLLHHLHRHEPELGRERLIVAFRGLADQLGVPFQPEEENSGEQGDETEVDRTQAAPQSEQVDPERL